MRYVICFISSDYLIVDVVCQLLSVIHDREIPDVDIGFGAAVYGAAIMIPFYTPIGTAGVKQMLVQWRRFINGRR